MSAVATATAAADGWVNVKKNQRNGFSGCKNRIFHDKFKLDVRNICWTKNDAKICRKNSVISQILHCTVVEFSTRTPFLIICQFLKFRLLWSQNKYSDMNKCMLWARSGF